MFVKSNLLLADLLEVAPTQDFTHLSYETLRERTECQERTWVNNRKVLYERRSPETIGEIKC
ncbi:hypothetical protein [Nostoc sp. LPT]|uniref:hypothetical protein n=1 Tax=Nostoc sp. LPT TaxID=2815387 RepID=UPI001D94B7FC|nr:hypothetical protein [Nostoc sp. LPT]MBN4005663.1 hypothetical protein [Nostoc sp. LPT]